MKKQEKKRKREREIKNDVEECPSERTFINRGNNNKRYHKNGREHTDIHTSEHATYLRLN